MYAILIVETVVVLLCKDKLEWYPKIPNSEQTSLPRGIVPSYSSYIDNPIQPAYQICRNTYTNSQLPSELDHLVVDKYKSIKRQLIMESFYEFCDIKNIESDMAHVNSVNQISIKKQGNEHQPGPLDNIHIDLREILDLAENHGWKILFSTSNHHQSQFILHKGH